MRYLPQHPNLDFLRREAKELLATLQESDPETSLSTAQRMLAAQYGYRDWTALKTAVESSRDSGVVADPALAVRIAAAFGVGAPTAPLVPVMRDMIGVQWRLDTDSGAYLVRRLLRPNFDWIDETQIEQASRLQLAAIDAGVSARQPHRAADGHWVGEIDGERWLLESQLELGPALLSPASAGDTAAAGRVLALLHGLALEPERQLESGGYLSSPPSAEDWQHIESAARSADAPWAPALQALLTQLGELSALVASTSIPPSILSICDLQPASVHRGPGGVLTLTHWKFAGPTPPAWELAFTLIAWAQSPTGVLLPSVSAFARGYAEVAGSTAGLQLSAFSSIAAASLNYLARTAAMALSPRDPNREFAVAELPGLLAKQITVATLEATLAAVGA